MLTRELTTLTRSRRLFQEWVVLQFVKAEQQRLQWFRLNQAEIRADLYHNLQDALLAGDVDPASLGTRTILPATFTGGPRYMQKRYCIY